MNPKEVGSIYDKAFAEAWKANLGKSRIERFLIECSATAYSEPRSSGHDQITEAMAPQIAKLLSPGAAILDVGSGQGPALEWFKARGFVSIGIDINRDNLKACFERGLDLVECDQNDMPEEFTGKFDCVWARHVIEHSPVPFFTLQEFFRVLKPGGILYLEVPAPDTSAVHESNPNHYSVMGAQMWLQLMRRAGFGISQGHGLTLQLTGGTDMYLYFIARKP